MRNKLWAVAVSGLVFLAACGDTTLEQGLMGAGAGAGTALLLGGSTTTGAIIGGAGNVLYCQRNPSRC